MAKSDLEFSNREDLEAWLMDKPIEWSQVIAARAALRVFPLVFGEAPFLTLATFRANFISWAANHYIAHDIKEAARNAYTALLPAEHAVVRSTVTSAPYDAAYAAAYASRAVFATTPHDAAKDAVLAAEFSGRTTGNIWKCIEMDAICLEEGQMHELIYKPLWLQDKSNEFKPLWALEILNSFTKLKIGAIENGYLIYSWYVSIMSNDHGRKLESTFRELKDITIAKLPKEFWERGEDDMDVEAVLADIAKIVDGTYEGSLPHSQKKVNKNKTQLTERTDVKPKSDEPTVKDELGRRPFAESLVDKINEVRDAGQGDGFAVHLHAPWGAGKTSILLMMQDYMKRSAKTEAKDNNWVVVNFNAWEHERRKPPWWPLMEAVERDCSAYLAEEAGIRSDGCIWQKKCDAFKSLFKSKFRSPLLRWKLQKDRWYWWKFQVELMPVCLAFFMIGILTFLFFFDNGSNTLFSNILKIFAGVVGAVFTFITATQNIIFGSKDNADYYFQLSNDPLGRIHNLFNKLIDGVNRPVCIYIDDLDRCHADFVVDLLEGIQSSFRHEMVTYVVAADKGWIRSAFETRYDTFKDHVGDPAQPLGYLFLEKIFQMSTPIPGMAAYVKEDYFKHLLDDKTTEGNETEPVDDYHERVESAKRELEDALPEGAPIEILKQYIEKDPTPENKAAGVRILNKSAKAEKQSKHFLLDFKDILTGNPREMKRLLNAFEMRRTLWMVESSNVSLENIFRWTVIEQSYPALADLLSDRPDLIKHFETRPNKKDNNDKKIPIDLEPFYEIDAIFEIVNGLGKTTLTEEIIHDITKGYGNYS